MPEKNFIIRLSDFVFIFVYFLTNKGEIGKFVVKLNAFFDDQVIELARYDSGFHEPHLGASGVSDYAICLEPNFA